MSEKHHVRIYVSKGVEICVRGWPQRPFCCKKVYAEGQWKFAVNEKGEYFSNLVSGHGYYTNLRGRGLSIVRGLLELGLKNPTLAKRAVIAEEKKQQAYKLQSAASELIAASEESGIKLTAAQLQKAKHLIAAGKRAR